MLTTIQELEREIDQFHKNIKDSNELMKILMSVASLTKTQTESFEVRTKALHDELVKLPPELSDLFQTKIEEFAQEVHEEHQSYQTTVANLMERYSEKIAMAESVIIKVPGILESQNEAAQKRHVEALERVETSYSQVLTSSMEHFSTQVASATETVSKVPDILGERTEAAYKKYLDDLSGVEATHTQKLSAAMEQHVNKVNATTEVIAKVPTELDSQLQKDRAQNIAELKQIQEQYTADLARTNDAFSKQLQSVIESIQTVPGQIKDNSEQHYSAFLKELEKMMDARLVQIANTEKCVVDLSQQLEAKYDAFVSNLARTNDAFSKRLQSVIESIQTVPGQIKDKSEQHYSAFLKELEKMMDARLAQLANTEKCVVDLSQQLEAKYDAFVAKLEATNIDQLYKYCQNMNKSINTKLGLALGGVAIAVIVSIISLFI